jgi:regulator of cell morphogenesis and NO signaling
MVKKMTMELFTKNDKLYNVIENNNHLLPVLNRFGIRLGFGDATIADICEARNINPAFFLDIINAFHNSDYFPEAEFLTFSPLLIVDYLQRTHQYYLNWVVPKMENQLESLILSGKNQAENLKLLRIFFRKYKSELISHIMEEEESIFPYVLRLNEAYEEGTGISEDDTRKSILEYEKEHSDVDAKLNDLKNLVIKFLVAEYDDNLCNDFLITLLRFERDLIDHARIEDKILVPIVSRIEKTLKDGK